MKDEIKEILEEFDNSYGIQLSDEPLTIALNKILALLPQTDKKGLINIDQVIYDWTNSQEAIRGISREEYIRKAQHQADTIRHREEIKEIFERVGEVLDKRMKDGYYYTEHDFGCGIVRFQCASGDVEFVRKELRADFLALKKEMLDDIS